MGGGWYKWGLTLTVVWLTATRPIQEWGPRLPFLRVDPSTAYIVFYRVEAARQFLFVYHMPERRLVAFEVDKRNEDGGDQDGEEAAEVVHHLPIAHYAGTIQYLALSQLPEPPQSLISLTHQTHLTIGGDGLDSRAAPKGCYLALAPDPMP